MSPSGLRERKKLRTKAAIQKEALRLFLDKGFEETTIEDIAAAVDISPSTFFNYFPSKEDVVFEDELDPLLLAAFDAQPAGTNPIAALRAAIHQVFGNLNAEQEKMVRLRTQLMVSTPELRGAMLSRFADLVDQIAEMLAHRTGKKADDFVVHNMAGAILGVMLAAMNVIVENPNADLMKLAEKALAHLEAGLPRDWESR